MNFKQELLDSLWEERWVLLPVSTFIIFAFIAFKHHRSSKVPHRSKYVPVNTSLIRYRDILTALENDGCPDLERIFWLEHQLERAHPFSIKEEYQIHKMLMRVRKLVIAIGYSVDVDAFESNSVLALEFERLERNKQ